MLRLINVSKMGHRSHTNTKQGIREFLTTHATRTVEENYNSFKSKVQSLINSHIPIKMTSSRTNMPWFNNTLKRMCKRKQRLFNKAKRSGSNKCWQQYRTFKRDTLKAIRWQRWKHINNVLQVDLEQSDPKPFWRYVRAQRQDFSGVSPLLQKGKLITDRLKRTNILNNLFLSVFTKENILDIPTLHGPDFPDLPELSISQDGVEKLLNGIKVSKASGPDLIPCRFLKELAHEIAPILTIIYKQSLQDGVLPSDWKKADVAPIFKKGSRNLAENYRPVSLTCVCCKLMEHIITSHIRQHLDQHSILSTLQHGFGKFFSCETQLLVTLQDLLSYRDKNIQIDLAVLDFSKAFDTVPHKRMLGKLSHYGIKGPVLRWIAAFLADRTQRVVIEGTHSPPAPVLSGVPQGTVFGPLLFLCHINDLPSVVNSQVRLFADDCLMYRPITSEADQVSLQRDLTALEGWGETWGMKFNAQKCQIMTIARGRRRLSHFYTLCGHILESVQEAKYFGIIISDELSWSPHVNSVFNRANSTLGFLRRNLRRCPAALKETSYLTLIRSVMEFAAPIWNPHLQKDINLLESVQRRAARFIKGDYYTTSSVSHMLQDLGLHELKDRRRDLRLALIFKVVHGHVAVDATSIGLTPADGRTRANHKYKFRALGSNTSSFKFSFATRTISTWNSLPDRSVELDSPAAFKADIERHLYIPAPTAP